MNIRLRKAQLEDRDTLMKVHQQNHVSCGGQLVSDLYADADITYVIEAEGNVLGYVNVQEKVPDRIHETRMFDHTYEMFSRQRTLYVRQIAVQKTYQGQGIGHLCYDALYKLYHDAFIYAFVNIANLQSMNFHINNGFIPAGLFAVSKYYNAGNYKAFLLIKHSECHDQETKASV